MNLELRMQALKTSSRALTMVWWWRREKLQFGSEVNWKALELMGLHYEALVGSIHGCDQVAFAFGFFEEAE